MPDPEQQTQAGAERAEEYVEEFDVIVIGAGITGLYQLHSLLQLGFSVRVFEDGGGVGGDLVLETAIRDAASTPRATPMPIPFPRNSSRNGTGRSFFRGSRKTSATSTMWRDKFDLRRHIQLNAHVTSAVYDEGEKPLACPHGRRPGGPGRSS